MQFILHKHRSSTHCVLRRESFRRRITRAVALSLVLFMSSVFAVEIATGVGSRFRTLGPIARSPQAVIQGVVRDASTGDPLIGATVVLGGRDSTIISAASTGADGRFALTDVPPGFFRLRVSFVGYSTWSDSLNIRVDTRLELEIELVPANEILEELLIESSRNDTGQYAAGLQSINPSDLKRVPMPDISYDLAGYLLTLPGFVSTGDRGGQLFVRGGTPTQNLVLLDGMVLYQPFHIVGFYSAFPADIIAWSDVYAGGFGARYGTRISSVIDIATRNGDKQKLKANVTVAPFLSGFSIDLPIEPDRVSLLVSVRESIIERVAPDILGEDLPFRFGDQFAKFHAFLSETSSLSVTALRTFDEGDLSTSGADTKGVRQSRWKNQAYGFRYTYLSPLYPVLTELLVNYSSLDSRFRLSESSERKARISGLNFRIRFEYLLGRTHVNIGLFGILNRFNFEIGNQNTPNLENISTGGAYVDTRYLIGSVLRLEPGFRFDSFSNGIQSSFDPRLRAVVLPWGERSRHQFSVAWGRYHQQIVGLTNEQDVADVFTIWAASPEGTQVPAATHLIAGWRGRFTPWLELSAEVYTKKLSHLSFPEFATEIDAFTRFTKVSGRAEGLELKAEIQRPSFFFSGSYSLSGVEYRRSADLRTPLVAPGGNLSVPDNDLRFRPPHDRRHQVNALMQIRSGASRIGLRWQFGSGLPFTQVNGYYDALTVTDTEDRSFFTARGTTNVSRSELYGSRLPTYHRLDVSFEHDFRLSGLKATLQVGVINAYNRGNIFQYNIFTGERVDQLPLIPSMGLKLEIE